MLNPSHVVLVNTKVSEISPIILKKINEKINQTKDHNFIELGSGYAQVSRFAAENFSWKKIEAVEIDLLVVLWCKIKKYFNGLPINYVHKNIFDYNIDTPSVLYVYANNTIVSKLYKDGKLKDCLVFTLTFKINDLSPNETYPLTSFHKNLFVYDFR